MTEKKPNHEHPFAHTLCRALDALPGVVVGTHNAQVRASLLRVGGEERFVSGFFLPLDPFRVWFTVAPDKLTTVLPFLAETVATNYAGHPFRLLIEDTGDDESLGPKGSLVLCYESLGTLTDERLVEQVERLAQEIGRWSEAA